MTLVADKMIKLTRGLRIQGCLRSESLKEIDFFCMISWLYIDTYKPLYD